MRVEYPRPNFKRNEWILLNGEWQFAFDDLNIGLKEKWFNHEKLPLKINVPFAFESKLSGINDQSFHDFIWYKRKITIPSTWKSKQIIINFGAVDYYCKLFVNGNYVGDHIGGNTPFSFNITNYLNYQEEDITLYVIDYAKKETQPRGKQFWEEKPRIIWYTRTSGIWQSVFIECVNETYIKNIMITPNIDLGNAEFKVEIEGKISSKKYLDLSIYLKDEIINSFRLLINSNKLTASLNIISNCILDTSTHGHGLCWTPENPILFDVKAKIVDDEEIYDEVYTYFGMRKIHAENGMIYLNNHKYYLRLLLDQGYWKDGLLTAPNDEDYIVDIELSKKMGFNGCRKHQKVEDPLFLYYADKMGFIVWGEMANSASYDEEYVTNFHKEWGEIILRDYNHPCIITWVPINESWGVPNLKGSKKQIAHTLAMYHFIKSLDDTRLVVSNDGWEMTQTDICAIHTYDHGKKDDVEKHALYEKILGSKELLISCPPTSRPIFVKGFETFDKPFILSEFGGVAYGVLDDLAFGYTNALNQEEFINFLKVVFNAVNKSQALQGFCYTQFSDVEQEINGLVTYERKPKCDLDIIRKIVLNEK